MNIDQLIQLFRNAGKRAETVESGRLAAVVGLDLEGRIYYLRDGRVAGRVNPAAIAGRSGRAGYLNPGGDGLWAAPEGTCAGYQYGTGSWRVPAGLVNAHFQVTHRQPDAIEIEAEIDLVNARQLALPCIFRRVLSVAGGVFRQRDSIEYIGSRELREGEFLLAPWSLCQFDAGPESYGRFPTGSKLRDLYADSTGCRSTAADGSIRVRNSERERWQIAVGAECDEVELVLPERNLRVRRTATLPTAGQRHIDIADADPATTPAPEGVRYSIYSDPSGFMEIESAGGCAFPLRPGTRLELDTITELSELTAPLHR